MRKPCIIVDIDNTLVDTAVRKLALLKAKFSISGDVSIDKIRDDFELDEILGKKSDIRNRFFEMFDAPETILNYEAPLFPKSKEVLDSILSQGIGVIFLTGRPVSLKEATKKELTGLGIDLSASPIFFRPNEIPVSETLKFKEGVMSDLGQNYHVITAIGDRIDDIKGAANNHIPSILFTSTSQPSQILNANIENPAGFQACADWGEVEQTIKMYISGNEEIKKFRSQMIDLYSKWLGEIDNKLRVSVSVASILCAISGKILLESSQNFASNLKSKFDIIPIIVMLFIFIFALISLIYALRSLTSRFTSGEKSGKAVKIKIKQGIAILLGQTKNEMLKGDALHDLEQFKNIGTAKKATAHRTFFYKQYKTYDPDALWNFRFFSVRAANYSKLYGERFASYFLILAILLLGVWISANVVIGIYKSLSMIPLPQ